MTQSAYVTCTNFELRNASICQNCQHFYQHYIKMGPAHMPTLWGHCDDGRVKAKRVYGTCKYFERME